LPKINDKKLIIIELLAVEQARYYGFLKDDILAHVET
jgi:hypothetical protein